MAYRRRKNVLDSMANALTEIAARFGRLGMVTKIVVICLPCLIIAALVLVFALPHSSPVLEASNTDPPALTSAVSPNAIPTTTGTPIPTTTSTVTPQAPTLKKGDENEQVQALQERLMKLGYLDIDESTQLYGSATESAVKWFQREANLLDSAGFQETGIADGETQSWLFSDDARPYTLLENTQGPDVKRLQNQLRDLGYLKKGADGFYGADTVTAVKAFQKRNNLTQDGKVGPDTFDLINSPNAKPDPSVAKAVAAKVNVDQMIAAAKAKLGKPYVSGNEGPNSFDCSGLVYYSLKAAGSKRGRYNAAGYAAVDDWPKISSINSLKRGDLMFFWDSSKGKIGHVSIYLGGGMMIDASFSNGKVVTRSAISGWCRSEFKWGRRPW